MKLLRCCSKKKDFIKRGAAQLPEIKTVMRGCDGPSFENSHNNAEVSMHHLYVRGDNECGFVCNSLCVRCRMKHKNKTGTKGDKIHDNINCRAFVLNDI